MDIRPKVPLRNYKNIRVKKNLKGIKDEDVEKYISEWRKSYAQGRDAP